MAALFPRGKLAASGDVARKYLDLVVIAEWSVLLARTGCPVQSHAFIKLGQKPMVMRPVADVG
ncbi:hypothetical protein [Bradyrhizobium sp. dw_78]|uniref:hypothetical protein n=1 Tax=Bradyrhizobium sp. dw_78 TaxID=2719793 RepID=UPI001BD3CADF|nr:hypothetical protein [Bradyrhizobium sp. dw_78]